MPSSFDDAHVAEDLLRGSFTLRIESQRHPDLFRDVSRLFEPYFRELGAAGRFADATDPLRHATILVPPDGLYRCSEQIDGAPSRSWSEGYRAIHLSVRVASGQPARLFGGILAWRPSSLRRRSCRRERWISSIATSGASISRRRCRAIPTSFALSGASRPYRSLRRTTPGTENGCSLPGCTIEMGFGPDFAAGFVGTRKVGDRRARLRPGEGLVPRGGTARDRRIH